MVQEDKELQAMQKVVQALGELDEETRGRVLEWTAKRFGVRLPVSRLAGRTSGNGDSADGDADGDFRVFADLFDAANPIDAVARALVGGYWYQVVQGHESFSSQEVNNALKDTGNGVTNITKALTRLQQRTPALVRQVSKSGRAKQARKTYKLTTAGVAAVRRMMGGAEIELGGDEA